MATTPRDGRTHADAHHRPAARERSLGEHIFIWIAWALAAAFWGATLTTMVEIFRTAAQPGPAVAAAPGAPGGSAYLVFVIVAFLVMAVALAWAEIRAASGSGGRGERATAALYNSIERQGGEELTAHASDRRRADRENR
ncbi:MAG TPA: hypothetical protein VJS38_11395 [Phenylobacterium sp.]|uniref:hypothetical protein n=1 Tax=Phenylobacterium sp. TaxID=1871053 RepID=UPI002B46F535|nr:hypothetical protein [Phenylobacterium sp.]HKR88767.1 hypothetical protein [Phenylobacterium sp.]